MRGDHSIAVLTALLLTGAAGLAGVAAPVVAQTALPSFGGGGSLVPGASKSYLGISLGKSKFDPDCGPLASCERGNTAFKLVGGGRASDVFAAEAGYIDMGKIGYTGGSQSARGFNLSLVGTVPLAPGFSAFGKIGGTYGWTKTRSSTAGAKTGDGKGLGVSYGLGIGYYVTPQIEVIAEYERHRFDFAPGSQTLGLTSIGVRFQY